MEAARLVSPGLSITSAIFDWSKPSRAFSDSRGVDINPPVHSRNDRDIATIFNPPLTGFGILIFLAFLQYQER